MSHNAGRFCDTDASEMSRQGHGILEDWGPTVGTGAVVYTIDLLVGTAQKALQFLLILL